MNTSGPVQRVTDSKLRIIVHTHTSQAQMFGHIQLLVL